MGFILSLETATSVCSVALHDEGGSLVGIIELFQENVHAQKLMPAINALFQQAGVNASDLSAVAVSSGPGSYTGLRIGVSTAKGMAYALGIPLIAVDTLDALGRRAVPFMETSDVVVPMIDARRMEVYSKVLTGKMEEVVSLAPVILDKASFETYLNRGKVFFLGDANRKASELIIHENAVFIPLFNSAITIGEMAWIKLQEREFEDIAYFEPNYLKEFRVLKSKKSLLL